MGRANITAEAGEGLYTLSLDYGSEYIAEQVVELDRVIAEAQSALAEAQIKAVAAGNASRDADSALDNAIAVLLAADPEDKAEAQERVNDLAAVSLEAAGQVGFAQQAIDRYSLIIGQAEARRSDLASIATTETKGAWCVDYTEDATGEVATIEVNGEQPDVLIAPGGRPWTSSDGVLRHRRAMSGTETFYHASSLPGWQKWKPTYRSGLLDSIDRENNTGVVTLGIERSSAQGLEINQTLQVRAPFEYMTCNHLAFLVGDEVIVQFVGQDWSQPKIIGFRSNPRPCGVQRVIVPLELVSTVTSSYLAQATTTSPIMAIDQQFSLCAGGQYTTLRTSPMPPGYQAVGTVQNFSWLDYQFQAHVSTLGVITSGDRRGDLDTFEFNTDLRISGSPAIVNSTQPDGYLAGGFDDLALGGFTIDRLVTLETSANGALMTDYVAHSGINFTLAQPDLEENDAVVTCLTALLGDYLAVPSSISVVPAAGGAAQQLQFDRFFDLASFDGYSDFPTTLSGLALMFRAPS